MNKAGIIRIFLDMDFFSRYAAKLALFCSAALFAAVALARGCASGGQPENAAEQATPYEDVQISVYDVRGKKLLRMPLEEYIIGVVASEMPASFAPEALKAQSVAARTYAVRRMASLNGSPCGDHGADVCTDSSCCAAWRSNEALAERWGDDADYYIDKISSAVEATAGIIALYGGEPIEALFHSSSGGMTENASDVFGGDTPYLLAVSSPGEENASHYEDTFEWTASEFAKKLNRAFPKANLSKKSLPDDVEILSRSEGGRVTALRLGDTTITGRELRSALDLPSAAFTVAFEGPSVILTTHGYGHGVGMSQYGADAMARSGAGFEEILSHYYTGITLGSVSDLG